VNVVPFHARRVQGPVAIGDDPRRFAQLVLTLAVTNWKLRFFGSALGYLWSLLRPLLLFGILYLVFSHVVRIGVEVEKYPVQLLLGIILYTYFSDVTGDAVESLVDSESLVRKVSFPRLVIPLSVALTATFTLLLNLVTVAAFLAIAGVEPRWEWLALPLPIALLAVLATGVGALVAALFVPFRDVRPIWDVVLQGLFYATPIFYPIEAVADRSETVAHVLMANPLAQVVQAARHLVLGDGAMSPAEASGGAQWLAVPALLLVGLALLGLAVFRRMAPRIAEEL